MLRQDPDVVMVGEIRDRETAEIAVQASLTGHLVLSTLHTNSAVGAITRLRDMGIEPFLLASSLLGVLAQRLVRVLCPHCKEPRRPNAMEQAFLGLQGASIYHAKGCEQCNNTGYRGRTGIYELLAVDENVRQMIHAEDSEEVILQAVRPHARSIRDDGIQRVREGITTLEEVLRVTQEE
jgi:general secretion pathway protein E